MMYRQDDAAAFRRKAFQRYATVARRLARLETLASDPLYTERLVKAGRDLRLCAAVAWASEMVERSKARLNLHGVSAESAILLH